MLNFGALFRGKNLNEQMTEIVRRKPGWVLSSVLASLAASVRFYSNGGLLSLLSAGALGAASLASLWKFGSEYKRFKYQSQSFPSRPLETQTYISPRGEKIASLQYEGDMPVVVFSESSTPGERGYAMAQLTYSATMELLDRYVAWVPTVVKVQKKWFGLFSDPMQEVAENIASHQFTFPQAVEEYLQGLVAGLNDQIRKENGSLFLQRKLLSVADFKQIICTYDTFKLMACTSGVRVNKTQNGTKLLRNLEWPSAGMLGQSTVATITPVNQGNTNPVKRVFALGVVPDIGGFTLANDQRLVISLNEAATTSTKRNQMHGMPQFLLSRQIAANCSTLEEVQAFLAHNPPATTHSLTIMDKNGKGGVFQMLPPGTSENYTMRPLDRKGYVHIANHFLDAFGAVMPGSTAWPNSPERHHCMREHLESVPYVRSSVVAEKAADVDCVHSLLFSSRVDKFKLKARWGNTKESMTHAAEIDLNRLLMLRP